MKISCKQAFCFIVNLIPNTVKLHSLGNIRKVDYCWWNNVGLL